MPVFSRAQYLLLNLCEACLPGSICTRARDHACTAIVLRNNRVAVARELLTEIYDIDYALRVRIDLLKESEWGSGATSS